MKIAHVLQWFELGGGESVALRLAGRQREAGHDVQALAFAGGPLQQRFEREGIPTQVLPKRAGFDPLLYVRVLAVCLTRGYTVVHTHDQQSLVYVAAPARASGARVIHTKHGDTVEGTRRLVLRRMAAAFVHAFVAVSETTAGTARHHREVSEGKLTVVENGVDTTRFGPDDQARSALRRELGIGADARLIGTVGRQERVKNPELLMRAVAPLLGPDVHLVLAGDGSLAGRLSALSASLPNTESIHLLGRRDDIPRLLSALDIFALSSEAEGLPLVILEAMATGLPVISTAVGGIPAVVQDARTGILVPTGDEQALRVAVGSLLGDLGRAGEMGGRGRTLVEDQYSLDVVSEAYQRLYQGARLE